MSDVKYRYRKVSKIGVKTKKKGDEKIMIYGYARVSTIKQQREGNSLEDQKRQLEEHGCKELIVEQYTGTTTDRPKFTALLQALKQDDTLMVTKLDRFARTVTEGSKIARQLLDKGVSLHILNMGIINNTPTGHLMLNILLSFAEFERDMIIERTQAGRERARTKAGYKEGRPRTNTKKIEHAVQLIMTGHTYKEAVEITGLSKSTIIRAVRQYRAQTLEHQQEQTQHE